MLKTREVDKCSQANGAFHEVTGATSGIRKSGNKTKFKVNKTLNVSSLVNTRARVTSDRF